MGKKLLQKLIKIRDKKLYFKTWGEWDRYCLNKDVQRCEITVDEKISQEEYRKRYGVIAEFNKGIFTWFGSKPQSPQPVWEKRFYRKWNKGDFLETDKFLIAMSDNRVLVNDEKIVAFIRQLLTSQNSTLREKIEGMDKDLPAGDEIYGLSDRKRGAIEGYNKALADVEDILNSL